MRFAVVTLLVLVIAAVALASPAKSAPPANACTRACPDKLELICGKAINGSKERLLTFGNMCVLNNYNCEHANDKYEKMSNGECGGKVSVRLQ